ncbi:MAG: Hpt domain-containing protein [Syntrophobacterales bacterium]|jgi:HPt (histidine-containing phosphotransfer) domain-containing protein|nr:Hpt domain-containing protein [Syntrophobacterales bacterium]
MTDNAQKDSLSAGEYQVYDREAFLGRVGKNEALAQKILLKFIDDVPKRMESIRGAIETQNRDEIRLQAHTIKGSSRNVGADKLGHYAERLEKSSDSADFALLGELLVDVQTGFEELKGVVQK